MGEDWDSAHAAAEESLAEGDFLVHPHAQVPDRDDDDDDDHLHDDNVVHPHAQVGDRDDDDDDGHLHDVDDCDINVEQEDTWEGHAGLDINQNDDDDLLINDNHDYHDDQEETWEGHAGLVKDDDDGRLHDVDDRDHDNQEDTWEGHASLVKEVAEVLGRPPACFVAAVTIILIFSSSPYYDHPHYPHQHHIEPIHGRFKVPKIQISKINCKIKSILSGLFTRKLYF